MEWQSLVLPTVCQGTETLEGKKGDLNISSFSNPLRKFLINEAFTSTHLDLAEQNYPAQIFHSFKHLRGFKQDLDSLAQLESKTTHVKVAGVNRYTSPLPQLSTAPVLQAPKSAVIALSATVRGSYPVT